ncbi:FAD/NAD(P)-binding domain superfamily protein [Abortiporus biennis]
MTDTKFTVAICGAGVAGLTLAVALSKHPDIQIDLYEAADSLFEAGVGIGLWPRSWKIVEKFGLQRPLSSVALIPPESLPQISLNFRKSDEALGLNVNQLITPGMLTFHRPDFQRVLVDQLQSTTCHIHRSRRLVSYTNPQPGSEASRPPIQLRFDDGSSSTCDLLIGADGLHSTVRACMFQEIASKACAEGRSDDARQALQSIEPRWSGICMYRATYPAELLSRCYKRHRALREPTVYVGTNTQITVYPISRGTQISVTATLANFDLEDTPFDGPLMEDVPQDVILHEFDRWEPEVQALFQCADTASRWAVHTCPPLDTYVSDRVALIGDAAHAMLPHEGVGPGQAIEDAYLLATLLGNSKTTISTLPKILEIYDTIRRPFAQQAMNRSRENAMLYTLTFPGLTFDRPEDYDDTQKRRLSEVCYRIRKNWEWVWTTTIDEDIDRAVDMLERQG